MIISPIRIRDGKEHAHGSGLRSATSAAPRFFPAEGAATVMWTTCG